MPYKVRKVKCKDSKEKANAAVRARWANESDLSLIAELIYVKLLSEISYDKIKYSGSHPEESYQYGWPEFDESEFDKEGLTTWHKDRKLTKKYLKSIGLL